MCPPLNNSYTATSPLLSCAGRADRPSNSRTSVGLPPHPSMVRSLTARMTPRVPGLSVVEVDIMSDVLMRIQQVGKFEWNMLADKHNEKFLHANHTVDIA